MPQQNSEECSGGNQKNDLEWKMECQLQSFESQVKAHLDFVSVKVSQKTGIPWYGMFSFL